MAATKKSALAQARKKAEQLQAEEDRTGVLDSRTENDKGDPWRETAFLALIVALAFVLSFAVMLAVGQS